MKPPGFLKLIISQAEMIHGLLPDGLTSYRRFARIKLCSKLTAFDEWLVIGFT